MRIEERFSIGTIAVCVGAGLLFGASWTVLAQAAKTAKRQAIEWGAATGGLRARILAVVPETDEQKPDISKAQLTSKYATPEKVTLLVELQNVGQMPIAVQGTRYGDSVTPPWPGKSVSDEFAPLLFSCDFFDKQGQPLDRPTRKMFDTDGMLTLSGGSVETIEPGKSVVMLIRPAKWDPAVMRRMASGDFQIRVHYHGPSAGVLKEMQRVWPDKPLAGVWSGDVASSIASFSVVSDLKSKLPELVWGEPVNGLRAAAEFRSAASTAQAVRDTASATFPYDGHINVSLHVQNVSDRDVSFSSETWRQDDKITLIDKAGKETIISHAWYSGWPRTEHWTLKPGQSALLSSIGLGFVLNETAAKELNHPVAAVIAPEPGEYRLRYELAFGRIQRQDKDGKKIVPAEGDWQGSLSTGATPITVRERVPEDEPPTITGRLQFRTPEGKPIRSGTFDVFVQSGWRSLRNGELRTDVLEIPECPLEPLIVNIRTPGFEETRFYDVNLKGDDVTPLALKPAQPLRFRLVTRDGEPVSMAEVRFFNRSKADASVGPYPTSGLHGDVWAASNVKGEVVLDMLQKFDPLDKKLGNNIYWFYIEPVAQAPLFIGPVEAGENLGDVVAGPFLEARGEIRGTPAELAAFSAEWDQPEPMKRGNREIGWHYAESAKLETQVDGDKLTFHLSSLRPGKLRIVSRFKTGGKPVSHVYSRREPNEDDVVFEVDLTDSRDDLVVTSQPPKP
jgi:hypothetical protein